MNIIERVNFIEKLPFEKQLVFATLCSERCYREIIKVFPNFVSKETDFEEILNQLWSFLKQNSSMSKEQWQEKSSKIFTCFEESNDSFDLALLETSRVIDMTLGMIIWGYDNEKTSASCLEKSRKVIGEIYDEENSREYSFKELEWLTKALYLIAESEKVPTNYEWFLEKNPDYKRDKFSKTFKDIK